MQMRNTAALDEDSVLERRQLFLREAGEKGSGPGLRLEHSPPAPQRLSSWEAGRWVYVKILLCGLVHDGREPGNHLRHWSDLGGFHKPPIAAKSPFVIGISRQRRKWFEFNPTRAPMLWVSEPSSNDQEHMSQHAEDD